MGLAMAKKGDYTSLEIMGRFVHELYSNVGF